MSQNTNLNSQIDSLLAALAAAEPVTGLPLAAQTALVADFTTAVVDCRLTAEELAASGATVRRIEIQEIIDHYIRIARRAYGLVADSDELPDWVKRGQETVADYAEFFAALPNATPALLAELDQHTGQTVASISEQYQQWQSEYAQETLQDAAIAKVHRAVDLRAALVGMLRYVGRTTDEIAELRV